MFKTSLEKYNGTGGTAGNVIYFNHYDGIGTLDHERDPGVNEATVDRTLYFINDDNMGIDASTQTHVIGYQVTYVACNCRSASFNASTTVYVELSADQEALDDSTKATIEKIVFEGSAFLDDYEHETEVGHWGDSPVMDRNNNTWASEYVKSHGYKGASKEDFYNEIVPLLVGTSNETLNSWIDAAVDTEGVFHHENIEVFENTTVDRYKVNISSISGEIIGYSAATEEVSINDAYSGASVSLDNLLSLLDSLFDYHKKELNKVKNDASFAPFYTYDDTGFQGTYVVEASTDGEITHIDGTQLAAMTEGAYLIYAASEGCASCAKFKKPAQKYVEKIGHKVYEVLFSEAKPLFSELDGKNAPQFFLINNGEVVAMMSDADVTTAGNTASYKVIYYNFTKAILSPTTR